MKDTEETVANKDAKNPTALNTREIGRITDEAFKLKATSVSSIIYSTGVLVVKVSMGANEVSFTKDGAGILFHSESDNDMRCGSMESALTLLTYWATRLPA